MVLWNLQIVLRNLSNGSLESTNSSKESIKWFFGIYQIVLRNLSNGSKESIRRFLDLSSVSKESVKQFSNLSNGYLKSKNVSAESIKCVQESIKRFLRINYMILQSLLDDAWQSIKWLFWDLFKVIRNLINKLLRLYQIILKNLSNGSQESFKEFIGISRMVLWNLSNSS